MLEIGLVLLCCLLLNLTWGDGAFCLLWGFFLVFGECVYASGQKVASCKPNVARFSKLLFKIVFLKCIVVSLEVTAGLNHSPF